MSRNPDRASRFENFKKWWFYEASKLIIQWYEAPSLPPYIMKNKSDMTKEEKAAAFKNNSLISLIRQYVELGWLIQDTTGIMIVTELGKSQLDSIATQYRTKQKAQGAPETPKKAEPQEGSHVTENEPSAETAETNQKETKEEIASQN